MKFLYALLALGIVTYIVYSVVHGICAWMCEQADKKKSAATWAKATAHDEYKNTHTKYNSHYIMAER